MFGTSGMRPTVDVTKPYDFKQMQQDLGELRRAYHFIDVFAIGRSVLEREIYCIRWGRGKLRVMLTGGFHGMEWITTLLLMRFLEDLCSHYKDGEPIQEVDIKRLFRQVTFYFVPMVNPDGVDLAVNGLTRDVPAVYAERLLRYNGGSRDFGNTWQANARGVDLNHNYNAGFDEGKRSELQLGITGPGPTRYSGERYESEPETQAMVKFTRMCKPHCVLAYHSQGEVIYYDYNGMYAPGAKEIAERFACLTGYQLDVTEGMASFSGYKDWVINELYIPAFTIEVGLGKNPLPLTQFENIYRRNLSLLLDFVEWDVKKLSKG